MNWKKLAICCVSFIIVFFAEIAVNIACGPQQDPYDYYVSYFHNNTPGDDYSLFGFNEMVYVYGDVKQSDADVNSAEWARYLKVKQEDVTKAMYTTDSVVTGSAIFLNALEKRKGAQAYYLFAKSCEPFVQSAYESWDPIARDSSMMGKKAEEALRFAGKVQDSFLKLRYAFQAARMQHYAGDYEGCKVTYETLIEPINTKSALKGWSMSLCAGAKRFTGQPEEAAYLFSKVFASNPERRLQAYRNYFACRAELKMVLKLTKSNAEKANVVALQGFNTPASDLKGLQQVYQYDPASLLNGALLTREVNKLEQKILKRNRYAKDYYTNYVESERNGTARKSDSLAQFYLKELNHVRNFAVRLAADKKYPQPELGTITAAYLCWMEKKDLQGLNYLATLKPSLLPEKLYDQYRIVDLLIKANQIKKGNPFKESELLPALKWLDNKRFDENKVPSKEKYYDESWSEVDAQFTKTARNFYREILMPAYLKRGDTAKAALAMLKSDAKFRKVLNHSFEKNMAYQTSAFWQNNLTPATMRSLLKFKTKVQANSYDQWLSSDFKKLSNTDFYELFGTAYLRAHQYGKALIWFDKLPVDYAFFSPTNWYVDPQTNYYANAFQEFINDTPKQYGNAKQGLNKKSFAKEMLRLQQRVLSDPKNAAFYYYKMANAVYQTGYYGNSWFLISYEWTSLTIQKAPQYSYDVDYKLAGTAALWYLKARALSKDPNFKARCTFMLAKCRQRRLEYAINPGRRNVNPYFTELKSNYARTAFYKIAETECSYFAEFIASAK